MNTNFRQELIPCKFYQSVDLKSIEFALSEHKVVCSFLKIFPISSTILASKSVQQQIRVCLLQPSGQFYLVWEQEHGFLDLTYTQQQPNKRSSDENDTKDIVNLTKNGAVLLLLQFWCMLVFKISFTTRKLGLSPTCH